MEKPRHCKVWKFSNLKCAALFQAHSVQALWCFIGSHTFFAARTWSHSVGRNYVCNLLCCVFWSSSKIKITSCHTVLISVGIFIILIPKILVGPNALRFFRGFKPYLIWACFHGDGRRCDSGSVSGGTQDFMAQRWSSKDKLLSATPLRARYASSLKCTDESAKHCNTYQLFTITILLLFMSFPGLCCGLSNRTLQFPHLALTAKPC